MKLINVFAPSIAAILTVTAFCNSVVAQGAKVGAEAANRQAGIAAAKSAPRSLNVYRSPVPPVPENQISGVWYIGDTVLNTRVYAFVEDAHFDIQDSGNKSTWTLTTPDHHSFQVGCFDTHPANSTRPEDTTYNRCLSFLPEVGWVRIAMSKEWLRDIHSGGGWGIAYRRGTGTPVSQYLIRSGCSGDDCLTFDQAGDEIRAKVRERLRRGQAPPADTNNK